MKKNPISTKGFFLLASFTLHKAAMQAEALGKKKLVRRRMLYRQCLRIIVCCIALLPLLTAADNRYQKSSTLEQQETRYTIKLPAQNVADALNALAQQTGAEFLFPYQLAKARPSSAVSGTYTVVEAVQQLLKGSGLASGFDKGVLVISVDGAQGSFDQNNEGISGMNSKKKLLAATVGFFVGSGAGGVAAEIEEPKANQGSMLEEVVVTAQKRSASLQDVPLSISAFSGDRLAMAGVENSQDLALVTPGLEMFGASHFGQIFIRGIGSPTLQGPGADPSSATYIDGVYQSRFNGAILDLMDVERVEVLKGPQGTVYGRNATGGAIRFISKEPGDEVGGTVSVTSGNYDLLSAKANIDIPLIENKLLARASMVRTTRDGYTQNLLIPGDESDYADLWAGRLSLKYMPSDDLTILFHTSAINDEGDGNSARKAVVDPTGPYNPDAAQISDPRTVLSNQPRDIPSRYRSTDLTINWDMDSLLFTSITGYTDAQVGPFIEDWDVTEVPFLEQGQPGIQNGYAEDTQTITQEFIITSLGWESIDWLAGVFYLYDKPSHLTGFAFPVFGTDFSQFKGDAEVNAYAAFSDISYNLTDKLRLNAGIRYSYEKKELSLIQLTNFNFVEGSDRSESWDAWTPKVGLDYHINDDSMVYFTASQGFKSGGYNTSGFTPVVDPEYIDAYEIGFKSSMLDQRLQVNIAAFMYEYTDLQVNSSVADQSGVPTLELNNAAEADITGLEIDISAMLIDGLRVDLGLSFLDAEYGEFLTKDPITDDLINVSGNTMPFSPEVSGSLAVEYFQSLDDLGDLTLRADYSYSDEQYFHQFEGINKQDSYSLVNARVTLETFDEAWKFSLYGKNLTDEVVRNSGFYLPAFLGNEGLLLTLRPPRTYGVEVSYSF